MSRRSRKRRAAGSGGWWGKAAVGLLVVSVLVLGLGYTLIWRYLHSDSFRMFLSKEVSDAAGVTGEFSPFRWDGLAVDTSSYEAHGEGLVTSLKADGFHTEVGLGGLGRGVWEIRGSTLQRLEVSLDTTKAEARPPSFPTPPRSDKPRKKSGWMPSEAELQRLDVREVLAKVILNEGLAVASGMAVSIEHAGAKDAYRAEIEGGAIRLPYKILPEIRLDQVRLRYQEKRVFLTEATLMAWDKGRIEAAGEWDMATGRHTLEGNISGMTCQDLLSEDWSKRVTGDVTSSFILENSTGSPLANGKLAIQNGVVTALPLLDALAAYADTRRFRVLTLSEAHTDWRWKEGELALTNLVLASEGLVRIEGSIIVRGEEIDGVFRLGLAPGTLASIPGAETDVFIAGERGLLWAPLRITGTLDDPKEDLTDRLIAAAGIRMFDQIPETGERVIKFTRSFIEEGQSKTVDKGVKIIEDGTDIIREVGGVLDGILGGRRSSRPEPPPDESQ